MSFSNLIRGMIVGRPRQKSVNVRVSATQTGLLTTVSTFGLLPAVTYAKTSGSANLTINASTGAISAAAAIAADTTQSIVGTVTGSDGCVIPFTYNITGFAVVASLSALTLSSGSAAVGTSATINIVGATAGSTITGSVPDGMTLNSGARTITGTPTLAGNYTFALTETLLGSPNTPRSTNVNIEIVEPESGWAVGLARTPNYVPVWTRPATIAEGKANGSIPSDAIEYETGNTGGTAFTSVSDWIDACNNANSGAGLPGAIQSNVSFSNKVQKYIKRGLYGAGTNEPIIEWLSRSTSSSTLGNGRQCWLYAHMENVTIRGIKFRNFSSVLGTTYPTKPLLDSTGTLQNDGYASSNQYEWQVLGCRNDGTAENSFGFHHRRLGRINNVGGTVSAVAITRQIEGTAQAGTSGSANNNFYFSDATWATVTETITLFTGQSYTTNTQIRDGINAGSATHNYAAVLNLAGEVIITPVDWTSKSFCTMNVTSSGGTVTFDCETPRVDVSYCTFEDVSCGVIAHIDHQKLGTHVFCKNDLPGTWGGISLSCHQWTDFYVANNHWRDVNPLRPIATGRAASTPTNGGGLIAFGTLAYIGNNAPHLMRYTISRGNDARGDNNRKYQVNDTKNTDNVNTGVMLDFRNGSANTPAGRIIQYGYNEEIEGSSPRGGNDAATFYAKCRGLVIVGNRSNGFGAAYDTVSSNDGSEAAFILLKEPGAFAATYNGFVPEPITICGNYATNGPQGIPWVKVDNCYGGTIVRDNEFEGFENVSNGVEKTAENTGGLLRLTGNHKSFTITGNRFRNVYMGIKSTLTSTRSEILINLHDIRNADLIQFTSAMFKIANNTIWNDGVNWPVLTANTRFNRIQFGSNSPVGGSSSPAFFNALPTGGNFILNAAGAVQSPTAFKMLHTPGGASPTDYEGTQSEPVVGFVPQSSYLVGYGSGTGIVSPKYGLIQLEAQSNGGTLGAVVNDLSAGDVGLFPSVKIYDNVNDESDAQPTVVFSAVDYVLARTGETYGSKVGPYGERSIVTDGQTVGPTVGLAFDIRANALFQNNALQTNIFKNTAAGKKISFFQSPGNFAAYDSANGDKSFGYKWRTYGMRQLRTDIAALGSPMYRQAFIWWQGEANTNAARTAQNIAHEEITTYAAEFEKVYADHVKISGTQPPWFLIQLLPVWNTHSNSRDPYQDAISDQLKSLCRWTVNMVGGTFNSITDNANGGNTNRYFVQHDYTTKLDTPPSTDPHVTGAQQKEIGRAIGAALRQLRGVDGWSSSFPLTEVRPLLSGFAATANSTTVTATGFVSDTCTAYVAAVPTGTVPTAAEIVAGTGGGITVAANAAAGSATAGDGFSIALNSLTVGTHDIYCCIKLSTGEISAVTAVTGVTVALAQTWNAEAAQAAALTYTSGNLKAANLSGGTVYARGNTPASGNGKYYFEVLITGSGSPPVFVGIGENDIPTGGGSAGTDRCGWAGSALLSTGTPGTNIAMPGNMVVNDVIQVCWDETAQKLWMRRNDTGTWNHNSADPASGTGGADISGMDMTKLVPVAGLGVNDEATLRITPQSWSYTPPSGFGQMT